MENIQKNVVLAPYTSFRIGGPAEFFCEAHNAKELVAAVAFSQNKNLLLTILGGGQNILIADRGIRGLVVVNRAKKIEVRGEKIFAESGITVGELVARAAQEGLSGLSWAAGLPGTLGGSIFGNAGTFGSSFGDIVESVDVCGAKGIVETISHDECSFSYKTSVFKSQRRDAVIVSATVSLQKGDAKAIREELAKNARWRGAHHPPYKSAGCMFKNPAAEHYHRLEFDAQDHGHMSLVEGCAECGGGPKSWFQDRIPAGWLIERAGLKGMRVGSAKVSEKHANFIVNEGNACAEDVVILAGIIKERVHRTFGVLLEEEVRYLGFEKAQTQNSNVK